VLTEVPSLRIKRPGLEADLSHPSTTKIKVDWSYSILPQYMHRDIFVFDF
jgi:hypothetical protein